MPPVELVPQDMMRVFINLIGNGFHAARQRLKDAADSCFSPLLKVATRDLGDAVEVRVRDNGTGIHPSIATSCSSRFSRPSRRARAPGSGCRSATTSSPSSMAVRSASTASPVCLPNLPSACRGADRLPHAQT
jgi:light-regulated signal transduction histidine kinase (bacteriophytochrome)